MSAITTGSPTAIASATARPNPSSRLCDGKTKTSASARYRGRSSSLTDCAEPHALRDPEASRETDEAREPRSGADREQHHIVR